MPFTHRIQHCDGVSFHVFDTREDTIKHMKEYFSYKFNITENIAYIDDFGGNHRFFEIPPGFDEDMLEMVEDYHTAINCGEKPSPLHFSLAEEYEEWELDRLNHTL